MTRSLLPDTVKFFFAWRLPYNAKLKLSIRKGYIPVGGVNNMNKLSLAGMQLLYLKNIRRISTSIEDPLASNSRRTAFARNIEILLLFFRYSCIPTKESLFIIYRKPCLTAYNAHRAFKTNRRSLDNWLHMIFGW